MLYLINLSRTCNYNYVIVTSFQHCALPEVLEMLLQIGFFIFKDWLNSHSFRRNLISDRCMNFETVTVIISVGFFISFPIHIFFLIFISQKAVAFVSYVVRKYLQKMKVGWFFCVFDDRFLIKSCTDAY